MIQRFRSLLHKILLFVLILQLLPTDMIEPFHFGKVHPAGETQMDITYDGTAHREIYNGSLFSPAGDLYPNNLTVTKRQKMK
jgi:hypothetical protein